MKESFEGNNYTPKHYVEKPEYFSARQEKFLEAEVAEMKDDRLLEDDFEGKKYFDTIISKDFIQGCKNTAMQARASHKRSNKIQKVKSEVTENIGLTEEYSKVGEYLEALFYKNIGGKKGWIPGALVWKTSNYDDFIKRVDFVIEAEEREFALATDLTFSEGKGLIEKLKAIKEDIRNGVLPSVVFYERVEEGEGKPIPRVIIATEHRKAIQALKLWADGNVSELEKHPLKAKAMLEIEAQLEAFALYAKALGKTRIESAYRNMLEKIKALVIDHNETIKKYREQIDNDGAYQTIMKFCEDLKNEAVQIEASKARNN